MKIILYRHKEPEGGLDVSKGFTIGFFEGNDEIATFDCYLNNGDGDKNLQPEDSEDELPQCDKCGSSFLWHTDGSATCCNPDCDNRR